MEITIEKVMNLTNNQHEKLIINKLLKQLISFATYDEIDLGNMKMIKINDKTYTTGEMSDIFESYILSFRGRIPMLLNDFIYKYEEIKSREQRISAFIEDVDDEYRDNVYNRKDGINVDDYIVGTDDTINGNPEDCCPVCIENIENEWYLCLNCGKNLCKSCFIECALRTQTCPVCNTNDWIVLKCLLTTKHD